ncbi:MAG: hypothetical protein OXJ90_21505, partial [Spirochaetaceae bacterium]|nr:hypothetical protein [Spirochaetaceae bacterium]
LSMRHRFSFVWIFDEAMRPVAEICRTNYPTPEQLLPVNIVENAVRESIDERASRACRYQSPSVGMLPDPIYGPIDLYGELVSKVGALLVVERDGFGPLCSGLRQELNRHG